MVGVERAGELDRAVEVQRLGRLVVDERAGRIAGTLAETVSCAKYWMPFAPSRS
jgi:hypothetical protein